MKNVLILGAGGEIARFAISHLLEKSNVHLTLYLRNKSKLKNLEKFKDRINIIEGDVLDASKLSNAMKGQDIVYGNLSGNMDIQAKEILKRMHDNHIKRVIWISSMGIYSEVPGDKYRSILDPYKKSAEIFENSDLDYTIIRPSWLNNNNEIDYELTEKGEMFKGAQNTVSRLSVADLILRLIQSDTFGVRKSFGINKP